MRFRIDQFTTSCDDGTVGTDAADLINVLTFAVNQQVTVKDLSSMIFAFPSPSSSLLDLLKFEML